MMGLVAIMKTVSTEFLDQLRVCMQMSCVCFCWQATGLCGKPQATCKVAYGRSTNQDPSRCLKYLYVVS